MNKAPLLLVFLATAAMAESGNSLIWKQVRVEAEGSVVLQASVDEDYRLTRISIEKDGRQIKIPKDLYCLDYRYHLNTLDVVEVYTAEAAPNLSVSIDAMDRGADDARIVIELQFPDRGSASYRVYSVSDDGTTRNARRGVFDDKECGKAQSSSR